MPTFLYRIYTVGKLNVDNQLFYDIIADNDIDDTVEWYQKFYEYSYDMIEGMDIPISLVELISKTKVSTLNHLLSDFISSSN